MTSKRNLAALLVILLVVGMTVIGCGEENRDPRLILPDGDAWVTDFDDTLDPPT